MSDEKHPISEPVADRVSPKAKRMRPAYPAKVNTGEPYTGYHYSNKHPGMRITVWYNDSDQAECIFSADPEGYAEWEASF